MSGRPPRLARFLLAVILPADERAAVLRDLDEEFVRHVRPARAEWSSRSWYWRQTLGSMRPALAMRRRRWSGAFERTRRDIYFAARSLGRRPALALSAILTLALGIGATTAIFSVVDAVILRPLPYRGPERLVRVWSSNPRGIPRNSISPPDFFDLRDQGRRVVSLSAYTQGDSATIMAGEAQRVVVSMVSPDLFDTLGVVPAEGRPFVDSDAAPAARPVAIVSSAFARARERVAGTTVTVDDVPTEVVGVMPEGFAFPSNAIDLWVPMAQSLRDRSRSAHYLDAVGRLADGATLQSATAVLQTVAARLEQQYAATNRGWGITVLPLHESLTGTLRRPLLVLLATVGCVLLIACANVAGLLVAHGHERRRETALRAALGASPARIMAQQFTESLVLASAGGVGALLLATWSLSVLRQMDGFSMPGAQTIALDVRVFSVTAACVILTALIAGLAPAMRAARVNHDSALRSARSAGPAVSARRFRTILVAGQMAVTLSLAVGAGLLLRSFNQLTSVDTGFDPRNVILAQVTLLGSRYEPEPWIGYVEKGLDELRALPGVVAAGAASPLPLSGQQGLLRFGVKFPGRAAAPAGRSDRTYLRWVTPGYFGSIGIPLISGRDFDTSDTREASPVAVVDKTFVDRYFEGQEPIGRELQMSNERVLRRIVAVVGAVRPVGLDEPPEPHVYIPHAQNPSPLMTFVVRTAIDPRTLTAAVGDRLRAVDAARPVYNVRTAQAMVDATVAPRRVNTLLVLLFAGLAAVLSAVGMYGLMAGWVAESTKELGVRMALGAERREVIALVLRRALLTTTCGIVIGLPLAMASGRLIQAMLFGVGARDIPTITAACGILFAVGMGGAYLPARRAVALNPVDSLRAE